MPATESERARIVVTGLGVVSAAGVGRDAFFAALADGRSGIARSDDPALPAIARIGDFGARAVIDARALRRLARMSQLALVAGKQALAQAGVVAAKERTGVVLGTALGTLRETLDFMRGYVEGGPEAASPLLFPSSVMNAPAGQVAIELGLRGVNSTINHREASSLGALAFAADMLALGRADALLVGAVDEITDWTLHAYRRFGALSPTGALRPYAGGRDGTVLGEGCVVLVLEREADARARGAAVLGRIAGLALGGEARPRIGWGTAHEGAARVVDAALAEADVAGIDVGYVAGGGAGLPVDAIEARAIAASAAAGRPYGSVLGQTGEHMSSAMLRVAAALFALERQTLPGTVGAGDPDPAAPIADLVREPRPATVDAVVVPSLSQGGANAALILTRA